MSEFDSAIHMSQFALAFVGIGLLLSIVGFLHFVPVLAHWDVRSFHIIHTRLRGYSGLFRHIWPLGTTPVSILLILIIYISSWQAGFSATLIYIFAAFLEGVIKLKVQRPRPFEALTNVQMRQPRQPHDPSHPSGDAMRVWFLALIFPLSFALPWPALAVSTLSAVTLSLGRIALGVHYPLDVVGGAGLGFMAAGSAVIIYRLAIGS
jgi:undecaprenyl-diphosphatase